MAASKLHGIFAASQGNCEYCGKDYAKKRCGGCRVMLYCNAECSKVAWKTHKKECKKSKKNTVAIMNLDPTKKGPHMK
ncbi:hypothetical protein TrLO_g4184 [Triparma laevis f. longispina]|uniref:MYND-type domain-containing protein n=1 Tax=Triparma laevis f. longispina TaxID=1714387 RepID=A0A9W7FJP4_9STRA|nr:hypothetical protein TrLO_g4184 [Triparma laevis f. longispina]